MKQTARENNEYKLTANLVCCINKRSSPDQLRQLYLTLPNDLLASRFLPPFDGEIQVSCQNAIE